MVTFYYESLYLELKESDHLFTLHLRYISFLNFNKIRKFVLNYFLKKYSCFYFNFYSLEEKLEEFQYF